LYGGRRLYDHFDERQAFRRDVAIAGSLTITNPTGAANLLLSGNSTSRVFYVNSGANLTLNGLTVVNGNGTGTTNPSFNFIGGGIVNASGTLTLTNSMVSGSFARFGGGIANFGGILTLTISTVSGNSAEDGGGISNNFGGTANLTNSTVSGNTTWNSGGIFNFGTLNLNSVTITQNGSTSFACSTCAGGIYNSGGATTLNNTIVAGNTAADASAPPDFTGLVSLTSSYNLIGDGSGTSGITNDTNGNQVGTSANLIDPKLDPALAYNGGTTLNHALLTGSPAIDAGNSSLKTDQRGSTRPADNLSITNATNGDGSDIGAFEVQVTTAATVSVSGRITARGRGISNAVVHLTNQNGEIQTARTNRLGYYSFTELASGETYIFDVFSKRYQFDPKVINLTKGLSDIDLTAQ